VKKRPQDDKVEGWTPRTLPGYFSLLIECPPAPGDASFDTWTAIVKTGRWEPFQKIPSRIDDPLLMWLGAREEGNNAIAVDSIIAAADLGCYPPAVAYRWFVEGLRAWRESWHVGQPTSLEQALRLTRGQGADPDPKSRLRIIRNIFLAEHMVSLIALGASIRGAATMIADWVDSDPGVLGSSALEHIAAGSIEREWRGAWESRWSNPLTAVRRNVEDWTKKQATDYVSRFPKSPTRTRLLTKIRQESSD
jgi:hypothetical protein